jgi:hypothetical protein
MAEMGYGYGSECHLLRYLGRHRSLLDSQILEVTGADTIAWRDHPFDSGKTWLDGELKGLEFLAPDDSIRAKWAAIWPQRGNQPNWDAVARLATNGATEWLLVEAKANVEELRSSCKASPIGGRSMIVQALATTKSALGVHEDRDWLDGYYQYCNRMTVLEFLNRNSLPARLLFIYFIGDKGDEKRTCPSSAAGWREALEELASHLGLPKPHSLSNRVHELFLEVCPRTADRDGLFMQ